MTAVQFGNCYALRSKCKNMLLRNVRGMWDFFSWDEIN